MPFVFIIQLKIIYLQAMLGSNYARMNENARMRMQITFLGGGRD